MLFSQYCSENFLHESLVINYKYDAALKAVRFTLLSAANAFKESPEEYEKHNLKEFHELVFSGVSNYRRSKTATIFKSPDEYQSSPDGPHVCLYDVEISEDRDKKIECLCCTLSSYGNLEISFKDFNFRKIKTKCIEKNNKYIYVFKDQLGTLKEMNFYNPFEF